MSVSKRNIYLRTTPLSEAVGRARAALNRDALVGVEQLPSHEALGRVLAEPVCARHSSPTFHSSAMDGIAVSARDTFAAREGQPVTLKLGEGYEPVNTGHALPEGRDAVIMIEHVEEVGSDAARPDTVKIEAPAFPWQHVRRIGEEMVATELLFPRHHRLRPYDLGVLLTGGVYEVRVFERPRVWIVPTGNEVLNFEDRPEPAPGQVVESNSQVLQALAQELGCEATRVPPVPDDPEVIARAVDEGFEAGAQVVIVCAGSSAGSEDYTRQVAEALGRVLVHGVAAMPGKPSLLAEVRGRLLVGAPGYPVSSVVCFEELVSPILAWLGRLPKPCRHAVNAELTRSAPSKLGQEEFLRLTLGRVPGSGGEEKFVATPLSRGAANLNALAKSQAVTRVPANVEGLSQGETVRAELLVCEEALDKLLVVVGSHDNTLDLLADELMALDASIRLASSHVGSMGGLTAIKNGSAHLAGSHQLEPETGDFNFPFIKSYLPEVEVLVVNLAIRHQGLMVAKGNPLRIKNFSDLVRQDVRFVNRQRGSGTRILLDFSLARVGMVPDEVNGYSKEEFTHMAVAINVLTGAADCGLGIHAAAKALDLDFIPLAKERYDLVIPAHLAEDPKITALLELLREPRVHDRIKALGGYETTLTGQVMRPGQKLGK